jgi:hypothetical protein
MSSSVGACEAPSGVGPPRRTDNPTLRCRAPGGGGASEVSAGVLLWRLPRKAAGIRNLNGACRAHPRTSGTCAHRGVSASLSDAGTVMSVAALPVEGPRIGIAVNQSARGPSESPARAPKGRADSPQAGRFKIRLILTENRGSCGRRRRRPRALA